MRVAFGNFVLDEATRQLLREGKPIHLEPKAFELLEMLMRRRPEAVAKRDIRDGLWPNTFVSESSLTGLVGQIRRALGDGRKRQRFLRTVHGFGYAFAGEAVELAGPGQNKGKELPVAQVIWEEQAFCLEAGENLIGRAEDASVRIDAPGVSRHHARITLSEAGAILEDLGSKNGTYLLERRLAAPESLSNGDTFRLGRLLLLFRRAPPGRSTLTEVSGIRS